VRGPCTPSPSTWTSSTFAFITGDPYNNAYLEIRRVLEAHRFTWQQGSVYFGGPEITAAAVMVAVIDLSAHLPWFAAAVRDVRMLRIEELNDLMPVVQRIAGLAGGTPEVDGP